MADPYRQLPAGSPVTAMSRRAYNEMLDVLKWWKSTHGKERHARPAPQRSTVEVLVKNTTASTVEPFGIMGLGDPLILPTDDPYATQARFAFEGESPTVATHAGKWAAMIEPVGAGAMARGVLVGLAVVRVYVSDTAAKHCDVIASETVSGETVYLGTGSTGAEILWLDPAASVETIGYAVVRLGPAGVELKWGKLDADLAYNDTTDGVTVSIWSGNPLADTGNDLTNVLPPPTMASGTIASGSYVLVAIVDGNKYVILAPCS